MHDADKDIHLRIFHPQKYEANRDAKESKEYLAKNQHMAPSRSHAYPVFCFSPDLHGKEPWAVGMHNQHGIPVEGIISVERDNTLLQKFLNPVGCFYHGKYVVRTALVRGKGNLKGIRNGDQIVVFAHRSILPLMLNVKGTDILLDAEGLSSAPESTTLLPDDWCIIFTCEARDGKISLIAVGYAWSGEGIRQCQSMKLLKDKAD